MYPQSSTIKGLSIATIILSIIGVLFGLLFVVSSFAYTAALNDPATSNQIVQQLLSSTSGSAAFDGNSAYSYNYSYSGLSGDDAVKIVFASGPIVTVMAFLYLAFCLIGLVASILALRNCNNPEKLGGAFGLSIAAAVLRFLTGAPISLVLFIILAVYIGKLRSAWKAGAFADGDNSQNGMPQPPVA